MESSSGSLIQYLGVILNEDKTQKEETVHNSL